MNKNRLTVDGSAINDVIISGYVMLEQQHASFGSKPVHIYDAKKKMYFKHGEGWIKNKPTHGKIININYAIPDMIQGKIFIDGSDERTCDIFLFRSEIDGIHEKWELDGLVRIDKGNTDEEISVQSFRMNGSTPESTTYEATLCGLGLTNAFINIPVHAVVNGTKFFETMDELGRDLIVSSLEDCWGMCFLQPKHTLATRMSNLIQSTDEKNKVYRFMWMLNFYFEDEGRNQKDLNRMLEAGQYNLLSDIAQSAGQIEGALDDIHRIEELLPLRDEYELITKNKDTEISMNTLRDISYIMANYDFIKNVDRLAKEGEVCRTGAYGNLMQRVVEEMQSGKTLREIVS